MYITFGGLGVMFLGTALVLVLQVYDFLKHGTWAKWSVFTVFAADLPTSFVRWLSDPPQDWYGLHTIVQWTMVDCPLWAITLVLGYVVFVSGAKIMG